MLSKSQNKLLRSLQRKKARQEHSLFLVEGGKAVSELLGSGWPLHSLYVSDSFAAAHRVALTGCKVPVTPCSVEALTAAGSLVSNRDAIAVARIPAAGVPQMQPGQWVLALDRINDPGNLGTLLRIADWYGIRQLVCTEDTVDLYNPKVISASMGSFLRVSLVHTDLHAWLAGLPEQTPVLGAYLTGTSVHQLSGDLQAGVLLMGSEAHGIDAGLEPLVTQKITIPSFGAAESLNVAVATAIICDNLRRITG